MKPTTLTVLLLILAIGLGPACTGDSPDESQSPDADITQDATDDDDDAAPTPDADADTNLTADADADFILDADADPTPDAGIEPCPDGDNPTILAIEGDLTHEATLHIEGCRFGIKEQAAPRLYDTVDNQPAYEGLEVGGRIPTESDDAPWTANSDNWSEFVRLATDDPRHHRSSFYRSSGGTNGGDGALGWPRSLGGSNPPADQRLLYVSWWYRPSMDPGGGEPAGSNKFIRVWDDSNGNGTRLSWTHMHITYTGSEHTGWRGWTTDGNIGEWNRMEITIDADRGTVRHYVNNRYQQVSNSSVGGGFDIDDFTKDVDYEDVGLTVGVLGFDHGLQSYADMVTDFGEIYIDITRARVEIGDAPTWEETQHREIQVPTEWSEDSLIIELQQGSFDTLQDRYLYVVDAEGRVNQEGFLLQ